MTEHIIQAKESDTKLSKPVISITSSIISISAKKVIIPTVVKIKITKLNDSTNYLFYIKLHCLRMESNQRPLGFQPNALPLSYLSIIYLELI